MKNRGKGAKLERKAVPGIVLTVLLIGMLTVAFNIQPAEAAHPWPMFRHDLKHTGRSPFVGAQQASVKWTYAVGDAIRSSPAIAEDGTIYVGANDGYLYAINPDGTYKWSYPIGGTIYSSPAIGSDGTIYIGSWRGGGEGTGAVYAIYPDGTLRWRYPTTGYILEIPSSPAIDPSSGVIYVGGVSQSPWAGRMYAINPDGSWKCEFNPGSDGWMPASPAIREDGKILIGDYNNPDGILWALNPEDCTIFDSVTISNPEGSIDIFSSAAIGSDGMIYLGGSVGDGNKRLWAVNPDLTIAWSFPTGGYVPGSPAIGSDGTIYVGSYDNKFYAINPNGTQKWAYTMDGDIYSSPAIGTDGTIYFGTTNGTMYALNSDSTLKWSYTTRGAIYSSPAIGSDSTVYVGSHDGKLYAFGGYYDVRIEAYCYTCDVKGAPVSVSITMDGSPTGEVTPHTFTGLTGTHTFTVPYNCPNGHPFKRWHTGETDTTITVTSAGTYIATYQTVLIPTLTQWGLVVLVVLIVLSAWVVLRRRKVVGIRT